MYNKLIIKESAEFVKSLFHADRTGHDWWHIYRVWQLSKSIAARENADMFIIELSALFHEFADHKFISIAGCEKLSEFLYEHSVPEETIARVADISETISFRGAGVATPMKTIEGMIVQDADRLDAMGAIGIARAFAFGGSHNRIMHQPEEQPDMHASFEEYKNHKGSTINHFYEKLLLLKDRMNTEKGKKLAASRHFFMKDFLERFHNEWDGSL